MVAAGSGAPARRLAPSYIIKWRTAFRALQVARNELIAVRVTQM